jgi:uncharacterized SAM-binding protein YcdF (DUF218 family)
VLFVIKQVVGLLARPGFVALLLAVTALGLRARGSNKVARYFAVAAIATAYFGSLGVVGNALLAPLEQRYAALADEAPLPDVAHIVVLGSGYVPRGSIPVTAALDADGLARVVEGIRLERRLGAATLILSGGAPGGGTPSATGYAVLARALGIDDSSIVVLPTPLDTGQEAEEVKRRIGSAPFLLVTSAYHMPRAMWLMTRAGTRPQPAPTGHMGGSVTWRDWLPGAGGLGKTERALHEYIGLAALAVGIQ